MDVVPHALGPEVILHGRCPQRVVGSRKNGDIGGGEGIRHDKIAIIEGMAEWNRTKFGGKVDDDV